MNDKTLRDGVGIHFLHASPDTVLNVWCKNVSSPDNSQSYQRVLEKSENLLSKAHSTRYSKDDARMAMQILSDDCEKCQE